MATKFYLGLLPWLVFAVANRADAQSTTFSAMLALLTTVAVVVAASDDRTPTFLNLGAIALFIALAVTGAAVESTVLDRFGRTLAAAGLAVIAWSSLLVEPLVEPYTRQIVAPRCLGDHRFGAANRSVTSMWARSFGGMAICFLIAATIDTTLVATAFNWLLPGALALRAVAQSSARWHRDFDPDDSAGGLDTLGDLLGG